MPRRMGSALMRCIAFAFYSLVNQSMPEAGKVRKMVARALSVWENNSKLTFREVYSDQADIQVLFARRDHGDGYKFDGPGQVLAHAFYPGVGRGGDAHFDAEEIWQFDADNDDNRGTNFLNVALHELGHSLGLGHSSDSNAVMFPWYQSNEVDGKLPDDDRNGIQELYGAKDKTWGPYRPRATARTTTTTTTTTMRPMVYFPQRPNVPTRRYPYYTERPLYRPHNPRQTERPTAATRATPRTYPTVRNYPTARTYPKKPTKPRKIKPDTCRTHYDAISMIRNELFIFRGQYLWRIGANGMYAGYPTETRRHWAALPEDFKRVDAVYEDKKLGIIFFIGRYYYAFDTVTLITGYPQPLTSLGLPSTLSHIDSAFVWGHNNHTYLTSGTLYWRLDDSTGKVDPTYPYDMSFWGVGYNIDAAFQYSDGKTYFFKKEGYWEFDDNRMKPTQVLPQSSAHKWMRCSRSDNDVNKEQRWTAPLVSGVDEVDSEDKAGNAAGRAYSVAIILPTLLHIYSIWRS
ncbi:matrix metalloproteinase-2 isoform X2 [Scaptodrosophila lebanonensis]|uniref:Matrix metalloproteinase-2 isoform X2 n=1 Tax=Drosophila lebanonensis TaxID=7225 RepID=A0A6J2UGT4_DROLE|nr:matrix metalloproteinase-2 isoform X2 [Scaptodrosophila lebanonensis]